MLKKVEGKPEDFWPIKVQKWKANEDAVFHHQMKHREESWKYGAQWSDELWGVSYGDETLCLVFAITSKTKMLTTLGQDTLLVLLNLTSSILFVCIKMENRMIILVDKLSA